MKTYAVETDGGQNYINCGVLSNLGSNLGSGFYCSFGIKTTSAASGYLGRATGTQVLDFPFNFNNNETGNVNHNIGFTFRDNASHLLRGATNSPTINFNDGSLHIITIIWTSGSNTFSILIDGVSQAISYNSQVIPTTFINLTDSFLIGARNNNNIPAGFFNSTISHFQIGTASNALYGNYQFDKFPLGKTVNDWSGKGNNGTLVGSPLPQIVPSIINVNRAKLSSKNYKSQSSKTFILPGII